ncbi:MAG TPA: 3'(2'),5'-bisphosphate nucleotidase CysQ [Xanthobacteraceae bacterium]|nr:3'(2'),5'-bisphosphate nucleotidase CysQ [Xanthobacteraceae bacterium]
MTESRQDGSVVDERLLDELTRLLARAVEAVLALGRSRLEVRFKPDHSPVTLADEASEAVLTEGLARLLPGTTVISEEAFEKCPPARLSDPFVLVDPLDGTKELVAGRDEFTINVAIVADGRPQAGLLAAPALGILWRGIVGRGAARIMLPLPKGPIAATPISSRRQPTTGLVALVSRLHLDPATEAFLTRLPIAKRTPSGSALKFCQVAEGRADVYPRLAPTAEWDIAAGDAVLTAAGGTVVRPDGMPVRYGDAAGRFRVPAFVAWGDPAAQRRPEP